MAVDINLVKELRAMTHAPLKDCKSVLEEANGDLELAQELLRQKGVLKAAKKADRETNNGVVKFVMKDGVLAGIKILCETDFVAKNEKFMQLVDEMMQKIVDVDGEFNTESAPADLIESMTSYLQEHVGTIGENLRLDYVFRSTKKWFVYNHNGNTLSSVVFFDAEGDVDAIAKDVALQVAAMNPSFISIDEVPAEKKDALREEYTAELAESNKPEEIKEKIIEGKIYKFLQDDILLEQTSIKDWSKKIKDIVENKMTITEILRVTVG